MPAIWDGGKVSRKAGQASEGNGQPAHEGSNYKRRALGDWGRQPLERAGAFRAEDRSAPKSEIGAMVRCSQSQRRHPKTQ
jgi:hypothetical protein